jgi:hypothetical protein
VAAAARLVASRGVFVGSEHSGIGLLFCPDPYSDFECPVLHDWEEFLPWAPRFTIEGALSLDGNDGPYGDMLLQGHPT